MSEHTPIPPEKDKTPPSYPTKPRRHMDYAPLPADVTLKPDGIQFQHSIFVVSVVTMVITSLATFYLPFFNGLLGGTFGGYHAGRMKRALGAAVVSSLVVPGTLLFAYAFDTPDLLRMFWGLGVGGYVALHAIGMIIGAVAGAASRPLITERNMFRRVPVSSSTRTPVPGYAPTTPDSKSRVGSATVPPNKV